MRTEPIESRPADVVLDRPVYRVHFWVAREGHSPNLDAWLLSDADDLSMVLTWAQTHADGRPTEVFVEWPQYPGSDDSPPAGVLRLAGSSPVAGAK